MLLALLGTGHWVYRSSNQDEPKWLLFHLLKNENSLTAWGLWVDRGLMSGGQAPTTCWELLAPATSWVPAAGTLTKTRAVAAVGGWTVCYTEAYSSRLRTWQKRGIIGLVQSNEWPNGLRTFGVLLLKLTQLPSEIQLLPCSFSECILHGMLQSDCRPNLSSQCLLPYQPVLLVTQLLQVNNTCK